MENITKRGIYLNLKISPYKFIGEQFIFYFSSKYHLDIFKRKRLDNFNNVNERLSKRFKTILQCPTLADLILYEKVETRGYFVTDSEKNEISIDELMLLGLMVRRNPIGQNKMEERGKRASN